MNYSWLPEDEIVSYLYQRLYVCLLIKEISFLIEIINNAIFNSLNVLWVERALYT